jgi:hypothetical protein
VKPGSVVVSKSGRSVIDGTQAHGDETVSSMPISKPYHRNFRKMVDGPNSGYSGWAYVVDRDYASAPEHYVRAFLLIQGDLQRLFEFIEPADLNLDTFSFRIHELFMRSCIEVEANFKAILKENNFNPIDRHGSPRPENTWNIHDYKKVNVTHHLATYKAHIPIWDGLTSIYEPFKEWTAGQDLSWYRAYNMSKHDRRNRFKEANLRNLLNAVTGLLILLSSQFGTEEFSPSSRLLAVNTDSYYSTVPAMGGFFHIEFPNNWTDAEKYDFDWSSLKSQSDRFQKFDYDTI